MGRKQDDFECMVKAYHILCNDGKAAFEKYLNRLDPPLEQDDINRIWGKYNFSKDHDFRHKVLKKQRVVDHKLKRIGKA